MKTLLALLITLIASLSYADEARILVKCDPNIKVVINGQAQNDSGAERRYSLDLAKDNVVSVDIFTYFDKSTSGNAVVNSTKVNVKAGETTEVDFRTDAQKQAEIAKPKPVKINFSLFGKEDLKKSDFSSIMRDKKIEPKKSEPKFTPLKISSSVSTAISSEAICTTRY